MLNAYIEGDCHSKLYEILLIVSQCIILKMETQEILVLVIPPIIIYIHASFFILSIF